MDKKILFVSIILFIFIMVLFNIFRQRGLIYIFNLTKEKNQIKAFNEKIKEENQGLKKEIYALKNRKYIEELARRKLGLLREDEIIYHFEKEIGVEKNKKKKASIF